MAVYKNGNSKNHSTDDIILLTDQTYSSGPSFTHNANGIQQTKSELAKNGEPLRFAMEFKIKSFDHVHNKYRASYY